MVKPIELEARSILSNACFSADFDKQTVNHCIAQLKTVVHDLLLSISQEKWYTRLFSVDEKIQAQLALDTGYLDSNSKHAVEVKIRKQLSQLYFETVKSPAINKKAWLQGAYVDADYMDDFLAAYTAASSANQCLSLTLWVGLATVSTVLENFPDDYNDKRVLCQLRDYVKAILAYFNAEMPVPERLARLCVVRTEAEGVMERVLWDHPIVPRCSPASSPVSFEAALPSPRLTPSPVLGGPSLFSEKSPACSRGYDAPGIVRLVLSGRFDHSGAK